MNCAPSKGKVQNVDKGYLENGAIAMNVTPIQHLLNHVFKTKFGVSFDFATHESRNSCLKKGVLRGRETVASPY